MATSNFDNDPDRAISFKINCVLDIRSVLSAN
jgi:hypothetical protein